VESASEAGCWLKAVNRGKPLQLGRTCHRKRTPRKMKTAGKAIGNLPGKYMIRETGYAASLFCVVDMPSRPLTWSIIPRHDILKHAINQPAGNSRRRKQLKREF